MFSCVFLNKSIFYVSNGDKNDCFTQMRKMRKRFLIKFLLQIKMFL